VSIIVLFSDLDPRKGGVQVSGIDAVSGFDVAALSGVVYGSDPAGALKKAAASVIDTSKARLVRRILQRRWRASVVLVWHLHMLKLLPFLRGFRGRTVLFLHGIEAWRPHGWLTRRLLRRVDLFLSNSDYTWQRLLTTAPYLSDRPHVTIPLGCGTPLEGSSPAPDARPSAVIVGRLAKSEDYKGHRELIAAWPKVVSHIPGAKLEIIGDGDLRSELEALACRAHLEGNVQFHGRVDEDVKQKLMAGSRCLVMPSRGEGFGIVYLEAMRIGRPCLVSDCDAGREVVNPPESGVAVDVHDSEAVTMGVVRLLSDGQDWRNWSAAARHRYEANYTTAHFVERLRNVITIA
jgi:phosphatidylinositol alpha-1,6-mannosyltransferase